MCLVVSNRSLNLSRSFQWQERLIWKAIDQKSWKWIGSDYPQPTSFNILRLIWLSFYQSRTHAVITCPVPFFDCSRKSCSALYPIAAKRKVDWTDCFLNASFHFSVYDSNLSLKKKIVFLGDIENPLLKHQFSENTNLGGAWTASRYCSCHYVDRQYRMFSYITHEDMNESWIADSGSRAYRIAALEEFCECLFQYINSCWVQLIACCAQML